MGSSREARAQQASAVDIAQGRELLNQGLDLRKRGDNAGALEKFKGAHALAHTPITGLELGRAYVAVGRLVEAREAFLSVARVPVRVEETARSKAARAQSADLSESLRPRIPSLVVRITGVPSESVSVTIDGALVPTEVLAAPRLLDPGHHDISARSTAGGTADAAVDLKEGETREVELTIAFSGGTAPAATTTPAETPSQSPPDSVHAWTTEGVRAPSPTPRIVGWTIAGVGVAAAAGGIIVMAVESGKASDANAQHDRSAYDSARSAWTLGLVSAIVGGVCVAGGGVVIALSSAKSRPSSPDGGLELRVGPGTLHLAGAW